MKNVLNRGFSQLNYDALVSKVTFIITQLTGNAAFPAPNPTLAAMQTALKALTDAMGLADPQAQSAAIDAARTNLEQLLEDLADNLEKTASNNPVPLATTGFDLRKETMQNGQPPDPPQNVRLKLTGTSGECQLLFEPPDRARGFKVQTTADPNGGGWIDYDTFTSSRNVILKGFQRAKDIWVRACALGPNNTKSGWSDPATILIN